MSQQQTYANSNCYGNGLFPHGKCQEPDCDGPACHRIKKDGADFMVCRAHLPPHIIFCPFLGQQEKLFSSWQRLVLGGGGAGGAKTYVGARLYLKQLIPEMERYKRREIKRSKGRYLFLRRTMPEVEEVIDEFKNYYLQIDPQAKWKEKSNTCIFECGYKVQFGGCEDDRDWKKYYGKEYSLLVFDEAWQFTIQQITQIDSRVRCADEVLDEKVQCYLLTNPIGGETKAWMRKRFVDVAPAEETVAVEVTLKDGRKKRVTQVYIPCNLYDNPALVESGMYESNLMTKSNAMSRALLHNDWYVDEGSWIGDDWDPSIHVINPFRIPKGWTRCKFMDYGLSAKCPVHWYAVDPEGGMVCYRAFTFRGLTADGVARKIREIEVTAGEWDEYNDCSMIYGSADSTLWARTGEGADSRGEQLQRLGTGFNRAKNTYGGYRKDAADQIRSRLRRMIPDPFGERDPEGNVKLVPALRFFSTCKNRLNTKQGVEETGPIITLPLLQADEHDPDVWDTRGDDHDTDTIGYACMSRPLPGECEKPADGSEVVNEILRLRKHQESVSPFPDWYQNATG